ncbi:MAG: ATP-dependent DNA ligase [Planctomycetota bacterium]
MKRFTQLYLALDQTASTHDKVTLLESFLCEATDDDAAWVVALFMGERPKGSASTRMVRELVGEGTGFAPWMIQECYEAVGDLSETVALLLPDSDATSDESLATVMAERVLPLIDAPDESRRSIIAQAFREFGADERFVYLKLIRGGFRVGVQQKLLVRALSAVAEIDVDTIAHRLSGAIEPTASWYRNLCSEEAQPTDVMRPYPFFLAQQIGDEPETIGDRSAWRAEWKWDGIRAQLIRRHGQCTLWSRGGNDISHQFPEIVSASQSLPDGAVLDGEVLLWRDDRPAPFHDLQNRLNRKTAPPPQMNLFDSTQAIFMAFDVLEWDGDDLRAMSLDERRARLDDITLLEDGAGTLRRSSLLTESSWDALRERREGAREFGVEGIMLKDGTAPYGVGRTQIDGRTGWWKWKVDPYAVDAVLMYAQPGSGRRANLLTDYTFGVWTSDGGDDRELVTFAKAHSGLSNDEIERLDAWIRKHTIDRRGPFRTVEPMHVFEIGFDGIQRSTRHRSGVAVRFPRILRWRTDKPVEEADSLPRLEQLLGDE